MYVIKRGGSRASVSFDKITSRITKLCYGLNPKVCYPIVISHCYNALVIVLDIGNYCIALHCSANDNSFYIQYSIYIEYINPI
jgi:hypothetical protein